MKQKETMHYYPNASVHLDLHWKSKKDTNQNEHSYWPGGIILKRAATATVLESSKQMWLSSLKQFTCNTVASNQPESVHL